MPLLPFLGAHVEAALAIAMGVSAIALFAIGATLSLFSGRGAISGGVRMLTLGACAGAAPWSIGRLLGVGLT